MNMVEEQTNIVQERAMDKAPSRVESGSKETVGSRQSAAERLPLPDDGSKNFGELVDDKRRAFYEELFDLDQHLRSKGASLRAVLEYVSKTGLGLTIDLPHADTKAYQDKLAEENKKKEDVEFDRRRRQRDAELSRYTVRPDPRALPVKASDNGQPERV